MLEQERAEQEKQNQQFIHIMKDKDNMILELDQKIVEQQNEIHSLQDQICSYQQQFQLQGRGKTAEQNQMALHELEQVEDALKVYKQELQKMQDQ